MKKRASISIAVIVCAVLALCGWTAYAAQSSNSAASETATGTFKSISSDGASVTITTAAGEQTMPLAKSVWVYRDEQKALLPNLKPGDQVEVILNSKHQAAYIRAASGQGGAPAAAPTAAPTDTPAATPSPTPSAAAASSTKAPSPTSAAAPRATPPVQTQGVYPGLDELELKVDGKNFKLRIDQTHVPGGAGYELSLKPGGGGSIHLKGAEAAAWIKQLLASVDLKSDSARQQVLEQVADQYGLDARSMQVQLKTKWAPQDEDKHEKQAKKNGKSEGHAKHSKSDDENEDD